MSLYPCILHTLRVLYGRETLVEFVMCLKRLITVEFGSSELLHLVNGRVCRHHPYIENLLTAVILAIDRIRGFIEKLEVLYVLHSIM